MVTMKSYVKSDNELKLYFKTCKVDVLKIVHKYEINALKKSYACVSCDYVTLRCWLCDQCKSCCLANVEKLECDEI